MKIGSVELGGNVFLAPMAGVTDLAFRRLCKYYGCPVVVTEMVSAKALAYQANRTRELMVIHPEEKPVVLQIFGSEPDVMARVTQEVLNHEPFDILDINMGCPAPKIVKNMDGSALMKNPPLAFEIVKAVKAVSTKPVTVKIRKGWDDRSVNAVEFSKGLEAAGADGITVHGRTRDQFYSGKADWEIIRKVKDSVGIPVVGNGDIFTPEDAKAMFEQTNCDGIMVGRGVQGKPWIFKRIMEYLETGYYSAEPTLEERIQIMSQQIDWMLEYKPERLVMMEMRKHAAWYLKGLEHSSAMRHAVNQIRSREELMALLEKMKGN
jgi:tRNA-dihydrouridine synthase B